MYFFDFKSKEQIVERISGKPLRITHKANANPAKCQSVHIPKRLNNKVSVASNHKIIEIQKLQNSKNFTGFIILYLTFYP